MFIPRNEPGVFYLFSRVHEQLGFEEIVDVSTMTPDVIGRRKGKLVKIELEYKSSGSIDHYRVSKEDPREGRWTKDGDIWKFILKNGRTTQELKDSQDSFRMDKDRGILLLKTVKEIFDIIVCWEKDEVFEEDIEIIQLKNLLNE